MSKPKKERDYKKEYQNRSRASKLRNWYKSQDARKNREFDLTTEQVKVLIEQPCFYCATIPANGLDRKNSNCGHISGNLVPACRKCNILLVDLSFEAKILLRDGLRKIREQGLFDEWDPALFRFLSD